MNRMLKTIAWEGISQNAKAGRTPVVPSNLVIIYVRILAGSQECRVVQPAELTAESLNDLSNAPCDERRGQEPDHAEGEVSHAFGKESDADENKEYSASDTLASFLA